MSTTAARSRSSTARRASRGSARASTRAGASSPCRSRACATSSPTTAARSSRSAPSATLAVATSAVRDAENGEAFLGEIEWSYGFATRLVSGDEEAALTRRGVQPTARTLVLDIGGGSTELVLDDFHASIDIGSVRFTERFIVTDPPTRGELEACAAAVHSALAAIDVRPERAVGVAGTVTTLAALDLGLDRYDRERVHGHRLEVSAARTQLERLAALPLAERRELPAMEPERAPMIVAGAVDPRRDTHALRPRGDRGQRARHPRRDRVRSRRAARAGRRRRTARRLHLLLENHRARVRVELGGSSSARRRCTTARERTPTRRPLLDDRNSLEIVLLQLVEAVVERERGIEREERRLCDLAQMHRSADRVPAATTSRTSVLRVSTPTRPPSASTTKSARTSSFSAKQRPAELRVVVDAERRRLRHHRVAHRLLGAHG